jgi:hypothetical protein
MCGVAIYYTKKERTLYDREKKKKETFVALENNFP